MTCSAAKHTLLCNSFLSGKEEFAVINKEVIVLLLVTPIIKLVLLLLSLVLW